MDGLAGRDVTGELTRDVSRDEAHVPRTLAASIRSNSRVLLVALPPSGVKIGSMPP